MSNYIVLDLETGGFNPEENPITSIALIGLNPKLEQTFEVDTFVKPYSFKFYENDKTIIIYNKETEFLSKFLSIKERKLILTPSATKITGLTEDKLEDGISYKQLYEELVTIFKDSKIGKYKLPVLVGHNIIEFDAKMLEFLFKINSDNLYNYVSRYMIDTLWEARKIIKEEEIDNYKLDAVSSYFGIELSDAHGALADTKVTTQIFKKILEFEVSTEISNSSSEKKYRKFQI